MLTLQENIMTDPEDIEMFYYKAYDYVLKEGYGHESEWCRNVYFANMTKEDFQWEYVFAVLSSSGLQNQIVQKNFNKFCDAYHNGENAYDTVKNGRQKIAIMHVWANLDKIFEMLQSQPTDEEKIEYLDTLPQIGPKAKKHLARNLGIDCVKPDRHMERLAERFGYESPDAMCLDIQRKLPVKERSGVIDVVLWRYCNLTGGN